MRGLIQTSSKVYRQSIVAMILIIVMCAFNIIATQATQETQARDIYIGDLIELDIDSDLISKEDLTEAFKDFEIMSLENKEIGYHLIIRTMIPSTYEVMVDGQKIRIEVKSTLDAFQREDIFEGQSQSLEEKSVLPLWIGLSLSSGIFLFAGIFLLVKSLKRKKTVTLTAYEKFEMMVQQSERASDTYLGAITKALKVYLSTMLGIQIIGLTSSEMIEVLRKEAMLSDLIEPLKEWLERCDTVKYRGSIGQEEAAVKASLCEELVRISGEIKRMLDQRAGEQ